MENQNNLHTKNGVSKASAQNRWWNHGISRFLDYSDFEDDSSSDDSNDENCKYLLATVTILFICLKCFLWLLLSYKKYSKTKSFSN